MNESLILVIKWICRFAFIYMIVKYDFDESIIEKIVLAMLGVFVLLDALLNKKTDVKD